MIAWVVLAAAAVTAQGFDAKAHYEKSEHRVAMRDGVHLHTVVYQPKDRSQRYPILLSRTPYSAKPYGPDEFIEAESIAPSEDFLRDGYILVFQDVRGAFKSEGEFVYLRPIRTNRRGTDESTDAYDTIEWLVRNVPRNNGRVGQWGISYDGWQTTMALVEPHPALKAASPQATTADAFIGDDNHFNGAFYLAGSLGWAEAMGIATGPDRARLNGEWPQGKALGNPWAWDFFLNAGPTSGIDAKYFGGKLAPIWEDLLEHPDYDEYWQRRKVAGFIGKVDVPVLNVAGWFDHADPYGTFATYRAIEAGNPRNRSTIVAGPWNHGGWLWEQGEQIGPHRFGSATSAYFKEKIVFPFFQRHLKGKDLPAPAEAVVFETGRNRWHELPQWPPKNVTAKNLYLRADGRLGFEPPPDEGRDDYVSDPARPVPYTQDLSMKGGHDHMVEDQRFFFTRPDVLSYQSEPLTEDLTLAGAALVKLFVSTTGTDGDWFVKLIDVDEKGYQANVAFNVMRGKYRDSFSAPTPMVPGKVTPLGFDMPDRFHTFLKGHRLMVQVQGSMFPLFDRNPQVFTNIYRAEPADYRKATQAVSRSAAAPSHIVLPLLAP
jgi:putative CocE/NonD family hydrolase